jgi:uncharacterized protein YecT (DUF1311 family)
MEPERDRGVQKPMRRLNPTVLVLLAGLVVLLLLVAYFVSSRNPDQDKLKDSELTTTQAAGTPEKRCSSQATYDLIKRELFRRAAQLRGSDQATYDKLANYAVIRMENPVLESQDTSTGAANCSGSLSLDLPPEVAVAGGRRTLMSDVDYTVQPAADGSGTVVLLRNADAIVAPLATLGRVAQPEQPVAENSSEEEQPEANVAASVSANVQPGPATSYPGRPSFDCNNAQSRSEIAVCSDSGLSALDLNMATQYRRAMSVASPEQQALLQQTRDRFLRYRDRCPDNRCIGDAYVGRMREIRDIMEGRWHPGR